MHKLFAIVSVAGLALAACGGDDDTVSPDTLTEALVEQGLEQEVAECISADLSSQLSEDDFTAVAVAQSPDDMPADVQDLVVEVTTACVLGDG